LTGWDRAGPWWLSTVNPAQRALPQMPRPEAPARRVEARPGTYGQECGGRRIKTDRFSQSAPQSGA